MLYQYHAVFITITLQYSLRSGMVIPLEVLLLLRIVSISWVFLLYVFVFYFISSQYSDVKSSNLLHISISPNTLVDVNIETSEKDLQFRGDLQNPSFLHLKTTTLYLNEKYQRFTVSKYIISMSICFSFFTILEKSN